MLDFRALQRVSAGLAVTLAAMLFPLVAAAHTNVVNIRVSPERLWQCGQNFYANGGSDRYRYARLSVDGEVVATYDLASDADCKRITSVSRERPDKGRIVVTVEVGGATMPATLDTRDWGRVWTVNFFVDQAWGEVAQDHTADAAASPPPPPPRADRKLVELWNTAACSLTTHAEFQLDQPARVGRLELWANWGAGERSLAFELVGPNGSLGHGTLVRADCDSYQPAWCVARGSPNVRLAPGGYSVRLQRPVVCANAQSGGRGFVTVWGD